MPINNTYYNIKEVVKPSDDWTESVTANVSKLQELVEHLEERPSAGAKATAAALKQELKAFITIAADVDHDILQHEYEVYADMGLKKLFTQVAITPKSIAFDHKEKWEPHLKRILTHLADAPHFADGEFMKKLGQDTTEQKSILQSSFVSPFIVFDEKPHPP